MDENSINPVFLGKEYVTIFMATNEEYASYCGVTLQAIIDHANPSINYDVIVGITELSESYRQRLGSLIANHPNFSLRFFDLSPLLPDKILISKSAGLSTITKEAFYRLLIPVILNKYDKVLYLDVDLVPLHDVADLYNINLGDAWIGGCQDYGIMRCCVVAKSWRNYFEKELQLDPYTEYINSGVVLFNVTELNKNHVGTKFIEAAERINYMFHDQDILNKVCQNHIYLIDSIWNETNQVNVAGIPEKFIKKRLDDARNHQLVHWCTNYRKPWVDPAHETGYMWWEVARRTPFYEEILYRNIKTFTEKELNKRIDASKKYAEDIGKSLSEKINLSTKNAESTGKSLSERIDTSMKNAESSRKALNEKLDVAMKNIETFRNLVRILRDEIKKRDTEKDAKITELRKQLQQLKESGREIAQLDDYRRKLRRVRWRAHFSWGRRKQRYLVRKKQLKDKIYFIEKFIKTK